MGLGRGNVGRGEGEMGASVGGLVGGIQEEGTGVVGQGSQVGSDKEKVSSEFFGSGTNLKSLVIEMDHVSFFILCLFLILSKLMPTCMFGRIVLSR